MSRKNVQRFCDDDMRKIKGLEHVALEWIHSSGTHMPL